MAATPATEPLLQAKTVTLSYVDGLNTVYAVRNADLDIHAGEFVGILGPSGSGKTSLLYLLSGIRSPTLGQVRLMGKAVKEWGISREELRRRNFAFVFQQYFLINYLNVLQNVLVGALREDQASLRRTNALVERLGLSKLAGRKPYALSGGERQRVAIARALVNSPLVLFADEPTANLDHTTGSAVMGLLQEAREHSSLVVVSHDDTVLRGADSLYRMWDGHLERVR